MQTVFTQHLVFRWQSIKTCFQDITSHSRDPEKVMGALQAAGFILKGLKYAFGKTSITHLGFQYDANRISPSATRIQTVLNWQVPTSPKELCSFLGLTNFYRHFVHTL